MTGARPDRRRLVPLRVLELVVRRDHPMSPADWAAVRRHARRGTEAPEALRPAVRADADAILHSSDLGVAPVWLVWGFAGLAVFTALSWASTRSTLSLLLAVLYVVLAVGIYMTRAQRRARAETALHTNPDPL
jgi:hypothetical protein